MTFYGPSGLGLARGYDEYASHVLGSVWSAFERRRFEVDVIACEGAFCGAHGQLVADHVGCYLGEWPQQQDHKADGDRGGDGDAVSNEMAARTIRMRLGLHWHVVDGKVLDGYMMHDAPSLFRDAFGIDL